MGRKFVVLKLNYVGWRELNFIIIKYMHKKFFLSVINILVLCAIVVAISIYFLDIAQWMGFVLIILALFCLLFLTLFKINLKSVQPDIIFGVIDNGILAILAIFGGHFAGVTGAILGGVVGNAVTDAIAGIFEGYSAEKLRQEQVMEERTMLKSAVGKMAGCLLGAGVVLVIANLLDF